MTPRQRAWLIRGLAAAAVAAAAAYGWRRHAGGRAPAGVIGGNGRLEAVEVDIAAEVPGRLKDVLVREGDFVKAGQELAVMDTELLEAHLRQARAQLSEAQGALATARSEAEQRQAELSSAESHARSSERLEAGGHVPRQQLEDDRARLLAAKAALAAARSRARTAASSIDSARAAVQRVETDIAHSRLTAPRDGRVQYRVAEPGEVLPAGGRVLDMLDLGDVYMTFFLPTSAAGRLALGQEARLVLDAAPEYVIPASISFVASEAQFTPKAVETQSEREKLMFRVRARIDPALLEKHRLTVKTGLPGMAYVKTDPAAPWPQRLQVKLPP